MNRCNYCDNEYDYGMDRDKDQGWWCDYCDGYNYFDSKQETRKFTLLLEDKVSKSYGYKNKHRNLNKRLSPLRYPGGKSKITDLILERLNLNNTKTLVGAYAGGASAELALLHAGIIDELILNDMDYGIYSLFQIIKHTPHELINRINAHKPTKEDYFDYRAKIKSKYFGCSPIEAAWSLLVVNRLAYSGIFKANPLGGIQGKQDTLLSRWNPDNLIKRIMTIHSMRDRITVLNVDACELIEEMYWRNNTTIFIDPPYVKQGENLYLHFYSENDHYKLRNLLESLHTGFPGADLILFYDKDELIENIYTYPVTEIIGRKFSV